MILPVSISHTLDDKFINQGYNMWSSSSWVDFIITGNHHHFFLPTSSYASSTATLPCYGNNVMWFFMVCGPSRLQQPIVRRKLHLNGWPKFSIIHGRSIWMLRFMRMKWRENSSLINFIFDRDQEEMEGSAWFCDWHLFICQIKILPLVNRGQAMARRKSSDTISCGSVLWWCGNI